MENYISAAVLFKTGKPLQIIHDIKMTEPGFGQIKVKITYSGVCKTQVMEADGNRGVDKYLPHMMGHEAVADVIGVGKDATKFSLGDKVVLGWIKGSGHDTGGIVHHSKTMGKINAGPVATFSTHSIVSENRAYMLPPNTPEHLAFLFGCALPTGAGLVFNELRPIQGSSIGIIGLGGVGLSALMACNHYSPIKLVAIDKQDGKLRLAETMGATHTINASDPELRKRILAITDGLGLDYVIEAAGLTQTIELGFDIIKIGQGKLIFASHPKSGRKICLDPFALIQGKQIQGSWGGGSNPDTDIKYLDRLYGEGKLPLEKLLGKKYSLADINDALDDLRFERAIRSYIYMG